MFSPSILGYPYFWKHPYRYWMNEACCLSSLSLCLGFVTVSRGLELIWNASNFHVNLVFATIPLPYLDSESLVNSFPSNSNLVLLLADLFFSSRPKEEFQTPHSHDTSIRIPWSMGSFLKFGSHHYFLWEKWTLGFVWDFLRHFKTESYIWQLPAGLPGKS